MTALKWLDLRDTQVADITPLAGLTGLRGLGLHNTEVADITPLAALTALKWLYLTSTQVADIAPLAGLEELENLRFDGIPACATDPKLAELSKIEDDQERPRRTLAYLRGEER